MKTQYSSLSIGGTQPEEEFRSSREDANLQGSVVGFGQENASSPAAGKQDCLVCCCECGGLYDGIARRPDATGEDENRGC